MCVCGKEATVLWHEIPVCIECYIELIQLDALNGDISTCIARE